MPKRETTIALALELDSDYEHHQGVYRGVLKYLQEPSVHWRWVIDECPGSRMKSRLKPVRRYDGVITRGWPSIRRGIKRLGVPWVNVLYQTHAPGVSGVYTDPDALGRLAGEHLLERGFKRFALIYDPRNRQTSDITLACRVLLEEEGGECVEFVYREQGVTNVDFWVGLEKQIARWIDAIEPPMALIVEHPYLARLIIQHAQFRGLAVPQDLALVCQRDLDLSMHATPSITSLRYNYERLGYEAAALLDRLMAGKPAPEAPVLIPPEGLIARETTNYFAVDDPVVADALRYISRRLTERLSINKIAYGVSVSPSQLKQRFRKAVGRGVAQEVRRLRVSSAKRMLTDQETPISDVARQIGFETPSKMAQVFRRDVGMSPSEYRKAYHAKSPRSF